jgi:large subunit ribosomal protein L3
MGFNIMANTLKGILGHKLGMTQVFDAANRIVPVTVVAAGPVVVTAVRTVEKDGYNGVQFAFGAIDPRKVTKPVAGHFNKAGITPRRHLVELRTEDVSGYQIGQELTAGEVFDAGAEVDVTGTSKGKGTAGVMKRHGFKGLSSAHGVHRKHRAPGSIGGCSTPGRVFKGLRMAGRMGNVTVTTQSLTVHAVDADKGLLLIKGAVPGPKGGLVMVKTAVKSAAAGTAGGKVEAR